jgi:hypothetical protein
MTRFCRDCSCPLSGTNCYDKVRNICKTCHKKNVSKRREVLQSKGLCVLCPRPAEEGSPTCADCKKRNLQRYYNNKGAYTSQQRERRQRLKLEALVAYGGAICTCCAERHTEFLTIDHINEDGAAHRRQLALDRGWNTDARSMAGSQMYFWLKQNNYPSGFRVLCFNCNFAKSHGGCPHERERATIAQETGT